jgi:hypothetical protein
LLCCAVLLCMHAVLLIPNRMLFLLSQPSTCHTYSYPSLQVLSLPVLPLSHSPANHSHSVHGSKEREVPHICVCVVPPQKVGPQLLHSQPTEGDCEGRETLLGGIKDGRVKVFYPGLQKSNSKFDPKSE